MPLDRWLPLGYVAGPYRAKSEWAVGENIRLSEQVARELWCMGLPVISPHKNTAFFGGACPSHIDHEVWLPGDLEMVRRVDFIVVLPGWEKSQGTLDEIQFAIQNEKRIFYWEQERDRKALRSWAETAGMFAAGWGT